MNQWKETIDRKGQTLRQKHHHELRWLCNVLRFELIYRLLMILAVHPLTNALLNYYINNVSYQSSLTNFTMFSAFLTPWGILVLIVILFFALLFIVFELLTLYAMTWCMLHKREYTTASLYATAFHQLKVLRHPSSLLAPIYFMGLLPLTHIGYVSSYLTTVQIPAFITSELSLTLPGKLLVLLFFGAIFLLYALLSFAIPLLFQETASFWSACRDSVRSIMQMPRRQKWIFALVVLGCFLLHAFFLRQLPAPVLKNSDFNIYLIRYFFHSHHFRLQLASTILYWCFLLALSMFYFIFILRLMDKVCPVSPLSLRPQETFFAQRLSARMKQGARTLGTRLLQRFLTFEHRRMLILLLCPLMVIVMMIYLDQQPLLHRPWVIGHRGDSHAPENSLAGIQSAAAHGADYAEIDIQLTADGELVVFHDSSTGRLSDTSLTIGDQTLQELQQIELSDRGQRYTMPSLQEAISTARQCDDDFGLLIELKPGEGEAIEMVDALVTAIEDSRFEDRVIFMSMDYEAITYLQHLRPQWWIGYCIFGSLGKIDQNLNVDFLAIEESQVNTRFLEQARNNVIPVYIWTVNDTYSMLSYLRMGVSGIIGDNVEDIRSSVDAYLYYDEEDYLYEGTGYPH